MRARQPALDFGASLPHWTRDIELSHMLNGISVVVMELEPFMNRVMRRARNELPADDPLYGDLETFVRQEANHTLLHRQYNQALYDAGYQGIEEIERMMREDYTRYLKEWPLRELLAYCEGFECLGPIWAEFLFEAPPWSICGAGTWPRNTNIAWSPIRSITASADTGCIAW